MWTELESAVKALLYDNVLLVIGILLGFIGALVLSSLLLYLLSLHRKFLLLAGSQICQGLSLAIFYRYVPVLDEWRQVIISSLLIGYVLCACIYALAQLKVRSDDKRILEKVRGIVALGLLVLVANWLLQESVMSWLLLAYIWFTLGVMLTVGAWSWQRRIPTAAWFTGSWVILGFALSYVSYVKLNAYVMDMFAINLLVSMMWLANVLWFIGSITVFVDDNKTKIAQQQQEINQAQQQQAWQAQKCVIEEQLRRELEIKFEERNFELEVTLRELEDKNRELEEKNTQDTLTGMRNRHFFDKKYQAELRRSRREQSPLSVVMMDIDHFKRVNDLFGHIAGDDVLRLVGFTLNQMLRRSCDEGCRFGGEEFALILPNTDKNGAVALAESIRHQLAHTSINNEAGVIDITVSCGIYSAIATHNMSLNHYIELADKALYLAKQSGRNQVKHYADCVELLQEH